ncbi:mucin-2 protein [Nocardioides sp.]|uniref:mucin-2 protein n=1 Tax=Nocardioides sp. TaxID=35761 RepID=UPI0039E62CE1
MAEGRHKRDTDARPGSLARLRPRTAAVAGPIALVATAAVVATGVSLSGPLSAVPTAGVSNPLAELTAAAPAPGDDAAAAERRATVSRSTARREAKAAIAGDTKWTTADLNLWTSAGKAARQDGEADSGTEVTATGRAKAGRVEVVVDGLRRWVSEGYLSDEKPLAVAEGTSMEPCPDPGVESGLKANIIYVYRSVCHAYPQITSYGGWDAHGEHASGRALDIMTSDVELGTAIAEYLRAHAAEFHLYDVIWRQRIWTPVRSAEGWRSMPDRGSATANHYDHVHVSTY